MDDLLSLNYANTPLTDQHQLWLWQKQGGICAHNLVRHGFDAHWVSDVLTARTLIMQLTEKYETFGFGGSVTVRSLGVIEELRKQGKVLFDHWQDGLDKAQDLEIRLRMGRCDCFFCSANAIAMTGEIVNVDGAGNRTNAMSFGTKKVVIVAGMNKVTSDLDAALRRIKEVAGPLRAKSLDMKTPCAETGICTDCNSPQRICRITTILHRRPILSDISVILINSALGF
jgi:hypothetical protein